MDPGKDMGEDKPGIPVENPTPSEQVSPEVPLEPTASAKVSPEAPLESTASEKESPEVPLESTASENVSPEIPLEPKASEKESPEVPLELKASEKLTPEVPLEPIASEKVSPEIPLEPKASEKVSPEVPLEPNTSVNVNTAVPLESVAYEKVSPEVPLEPAVSAKVNPEVPLPPTVSAKVNPEVPLEPAVSAKVNPEVPLPPTESAKVNPEVPLPPTESAKVNPEVPLPPTESAKVNPEVPLPPSVSAQGNPEVPLPPSMSAQGNPKVSSQSTKSTSTYPLELIVVASPQNEEEPAAATETNPENHGESKIKVLENELKPASSKQGQTLPTDGNNLHDNQPWVLEPKIPNWPEELNIPGQGKGLPDMGKGGNNSLEDQKWILDPTIRYWPPELDYPGQGADMGEGQSKPNGGEGQLNLPGDGNNAFEGQNWGLEPLIPYWPPELNYPGQGGVMSEGQSESKGDQVQLNLPGDGNNAFEGQNWGLEPSIPYWPPELNYPGQGGVMSEGQSESKGDQVQPNLSGEGNNAFDAQNWGLEPSVPYWPPEFNYPGQGQEISEGAMRPQTAPTDLSNLPDGGINSFEEQEWRLELGNQYWPPELNYPGQGQGLPQSQQLGPSQHPMTGPEPTLAEGGSNSFENRKWQLDPLLQYWYPELNYPGQGQELLEGQQNLPSGGSNLYEEQKWQLEPNPHYGSPDLNNQTQAIPATDFPSDGTNLHEDQLWQLEHYPPMWPLDYNYPGQSTDKSYPPETQQGNAMAQMQTPVYPASLVPEGGSNAYEDQPWILEKMLPSTLDEKETYGNGQMENGFEEQYDQNCDPCSRQGNRNSKYTQTRRTMSFTESALAFIDTIAFLDSAPCNTCDVPQPCEENSNEDVWSWIYNSLADIIDQVKNLSGHQCVDPSKAAVAGSAGDQSGNNNISVNPQSQPADLAEDEFNFPTT